MMTCNACDCADPTAAQGLADDCDCVCHWRRSMDVAKPAADISKTTTWRITEQDGTERRESIPVPVSKTPEAARRRFERNTQRQKAIYKGLNRKARPDR